MKLPSYLLDSSREMIVVAIEIKPDKMETGLIFVLYFVVFVNINGETQFICMF